MSTTIAPTGFTQEAFESFLASRDEPGWLSDLRRRAWERFESLGMPTQRDEEWMRTDIRLFKLDRFAPTSEVAADLVMPHALLAEGVELGGQAVSLDSHSIESNLASELADKGVLFGSLDKLLSEHGDQLRPYFERKLVDPHYDKFAALNAAFWSGGTALFVPKGVRVEQPLHGFSVLTEDGIDLGKQLVILEEGAEATLMSEATNVDGANSGLHCGSIELIVEKNALLRYVNLQNWGDEVWHFAHQMAHIAGNGKLQWTIGALGSRLAKVNQHVALTGQDAEAQVNGVMFTQGKQHLCYNTHQHHCAEYCQSDLLYKAALQDTSRTVWRGMIKVDEGAQRTNAYQRNDNLMLATHRPG